MAWINPATQARLEVAWQHEMLHRMRKIPQKPSELWNDPMKLQTPAQMYRRMRAFVEDMKKTKKK
ncbi:MAG: hypothetical protein E5W82_10845 [Mesorhizobium sp.]|nr:MAG: hypothetical protein E5W82_10845 [Mesorhizobium sp.]